MLIGELCLQCPFQSKDVLCSSVLTVPVYVPVWWGYVEEAEAVAAAVEGQDS